jgi:hypothetical protein
VTASGFSGSGDHHGKQSTTRGEKMARVLKILGAAVLVVLALSAVVSSGASAAMVLPDFTVATNATGTGGAASLLGPVAIKATGLDVKLTAINELEGTFDINFLGVTLLGEECHSLGDKEKVILATGTYKLVLTLKPAGTDVRLVLLTLEPPVHIECKVLSTLIVVSGTILGTLTANAAGKQNKFTIKVNAKSATEQEFKSYENDAGTAVPTKLLCEVLENKKPEECAEEAGTTLITTAAATELIN